MSKNEAIENSCNVDISMDEDRLFLIKAKLDSGEYNLSPKRKNAYVWCIFGKIENHLGDEISPHLVACRFCHSVLKYTTRTTSNLVRHKCYIAKMKEGALTKEAVGKKCAKPDGYEPKTGNPTNDDFLKEKASFTSIFTKIRKGEFKIGNITGRSNVWHIFGTIENRYNEQLHPNLVACRICNHIYKFNGRSTSNLVKHKCYIRKLKENAFGSGEEEKSESYIKKLRENAFASAEEEESEFNVDASLTEDTCFSEEKSQFNVDASMTEDTCFSEVEELNTEIKTEKEELCCRPFTCGAIRQQIYGAVFFGKTCPQPPQKLSQFCW